MKHTSHTCDSCGDEAKPAPATRTFKPTVSRSLQGEVEVRIMLNHDVADLCAGCRKALVREAIFMAQQTAANEP